YRKNGDLLGYVEEKYFVMIVKAAKTGTTVTITAHLMKRGFIMALIELIPGRSLAILRLGLRKAKTASCPMTFLPRKFDRVFPERARPLILKLIRHLYTVSTAGKPEDRKYVGMIPCVVSRLLARYRRDYYIHLTALTGPLVRIRLYPKGG